MRHASHSLGLLVGLLAATSAAHAQDRPLTFPTRDVAVTYRASGGPGNQTAELRMSFLVAEQKLRVDLPGGVGWSVMDGRGGRAFTVLEGQRMIMEMPVGAEGMPLPQPSPTARFTRSGTATVAGNTCTVWQYQDNQDRGEACVTADGVMLRARGSRGDQSGSIEATAVQYGPQDGARFRAPQGYQTMQMPNMPGGMPGAGGAAPPPGMGRPPGR